jgi:hypothetical protein
MARAVDMGLLGRERLGQAASERQAAQQRETTEKNLHITSGRVLRQNMKFEISQS